MSKVWVKQIFAAAAMAGMLAAGVAHAQTAPAATDMAAPAADAAAGMAKSAADAAKAKAKKVAKPKKAVVKKLPMVTVTIENTRTVGLVELTAALPGADPVKIAGPLAATKKTVAHVGHDKACLFDLHGSFADGAELDTATVNLCKEKKISLTD